MTTKELIGDATPAQKGKTMNNHKQSPTDEKRRRDTLLIVLKAAEEAGASMRGKSAQQTSYRRWLQEQDEAIKQHFSVAREGSE